MVMTMAMALIDRSIDVEESHSVGHMQTEYKIGRPTTWQNPRRHQHLRHKVAYTQTPAEPVQEATSFQRSRDLGPTNLQPIKTAQRTDRCKLGYGALRTLSATDNQRCTAYKP